MTFSGLPDALAAAASAASAKPGTDSLSRARYSQTARRFITAAEQLTSRLIDMVRAADRGVLGSSVPWGTKRTFHA